MSVKTVKVAISLPKDTMSQIEHFRQKLGIPRSQAIFEAVSFWLKNMEEESMERRYVRGYAEKPEKVSDADHLYVAGLSSFSGDRW